MGRTLGAATVAVLAAMAPLPALAQGKAHAPVLIVHGDNDEVIPIAFGRRLFKLANPPKRFVVVPGGTHPAMETVMPMATAWIDATVPPPLPSKAG